jgi:hypothetical protein
MHKYIFLRGFVERLNNYQIIYLDDFFSLYNDWFIDIRKLLENEIHENLFLTSTNKIKYLEYSKKTINNEVVYIPNSLFLDKWIKIYELDKFEFPFIENEEVKELLSTNIRQPNLDNLTRKKCTNMQIDFYCYVALNEKMNMIEFINELLLQENDNIFSASTNSVLKIDNNVFEHEGIEIMAGYGSIKAPNNTHKITSKEPTKKISDKWHALLYLIEVEVHKKKIPTNNDGDFIKSQLEEIGRQRCKNSGQGFYRQVRDLKDNINSNIGIKRLFNDDWVDVIIELSKNDKKIIKYLNKNYK